MREMLDGCRRVRRSPGLVLALLVVDVSLALLLARLVPTAKPRAWPAESTTAPCLDWGQEWRSAWSEWETGTAPRLGPDVLGLGLHGCAAEPDRRRWGWLALGLLALLARAFATGGALGVLRAPQGGWKARGFVLGARFYFPRLVRAALMSTMATAVALVLLPVPALFAPLVLFIHVIASYAKVIMVLEDRPSAVLAFVAALGFAGRHPRRVILPFAMAAVMGALLLSGLRSYPSLLAAGIVVTSGIALRLWLLATQVAVYRPRPAL